MVTNYSFLLVVTADVANVNLANVVCPGSVRGLTFSFYFISTSQTLLPRSGYDLLNSSWQEGL